MTLCLFDELSSLLLTVAVNGGWGAFGNYSSCSKRCGGGIQRRKRLCNNPLPMNGGATCQGSEVERRPCNTGLCPGKEIS